MPKTYSEEERAQIIAKLKQEANLLMQEKGVKKTTVDELVARVGIPKGTFYLFYPSKEMLLFDVSQDFHEEVDSYIAKGVRNIREEKARKEDGWVDWSECVEELTDVFLGAFTITYNSCLRVLLNPESMALILQKLPKDVWENHRTEDEGRWDGMFEELSGKKTIDSNAMVGSFMMIIFGGMYKREVGEAVWNDSMRMLIKGVVLQLVGQP